MNCPSNEHFPSRGFLNTGSRAIDFETFAFGGSILFQVFIESIARQLRLMAMNSRHFISSVNN